MGEGLGTGLSQGLTLPTEASLQATQGLHALSLEMHMGEKEHLS